MPKKIPQDVVDQWIEMADRGLSAWEIRKALESTSDVRTIENTIYRVKAERAAGEIRTRASVQALIDHWKMLIDSVSDLSKATKNPLSIGKMSAAYSIDATAMTGPGWTARRKVTVAGASDWEVRLDYVETVGAQLLREHTGNNSLWREVDMFRTRVSEFITARLGLAKTVLSAVEEIASSGTLQANRCLVDLAGVAIVDEAMFKAATSEDDAVTDILKGSSTEQDGKQLWIRGALLLTNADQIPSSITESLVEKLDNLKKSRDWKAVIAAEAALTRAAVELDREIVVARLTTALPGSCRACRAFAAG